MLQTFASVLVTAASLAIAIATLMADELKGKKAFKAGVVTFCSVVAVLGIYFSILDVQPEKRSSIPTQVATAVLSPQPSISETGLVEQTPQPPVIHTVIVTRIVVASVTPESKLTRTPTLFGLPFSDNFDKGLNAIWIRAGGDWNMVNGKIANRANDAGIIWLAGEWADVVVEADLDGSSCNYNGIEILVRMQDTNNYIALRGIGCSSDWPTGLYLYKDGKAVKQIVGFNGGPGHWKIIAAKNIYEIYLNSRLLGRASDDNLTAGGAGIFMGGASTTVDNYSVQQYKNP